MKPVSLRGIARIVRYAANVQCPFAVNQIGDEGNAVHWRAAKRLIQKIAPFATNKLKVRIF
jgi:hypothetical protein